MEGPAEGGRETQEPMQEQGLMIYPASGWRWLFFRAPMWAWRMGLAPLMRFRFCVLTCFGRKSGEPRHTMLEWVEDGGKLYFAAGWGQRSQWVRNLLEDPRVTVDSGLGIVRGRALRVVDGDLMRRLYPQMKKSPTWTQYCASWGVDGSDIDDVAAKADQLWTFVVETDETDETDEPGKDAETLPPMEIDLFWMPAMLILGIGVAVVGYLGRN